MTPTIILNFSNNKDDYLHNIVNEQKAIKQALLDFDDNNYLEVRDLQHSSTKDIFYMINRYHNRVAIWHYAGHADGQSIQLESDIGVVQSANVKGIAGLLGTQKDLKLVFLNGCATQGQVKALLQNGVKAVIATSVPINDNTAVNFATQFYQALSKDSTIREAFVKAKAFVETSSKMPIQDVNATRGFVFADTEVTTAIPWGLYWNDGAEAVLDWKLPTKSMYNIDLGSGTFHQTKSEINTTLVKKTGRAIKDGEVVQELIKKIAQIQQEENDKNRKATDAERKDAIIRSYLAPISVQIRTLFTETCSQQYDKNRLKQLFITYRETIKLVTFSMLSNIWDEAHQRHLAEKTPLKLSDNQQLQIEAFFGINEFTQASFDYFQLANALLEIGQSNGLTFYIKELNDYKNGWSANEILAKANTHFQTMQTALEGDISSKLIQPYCVASEQQLAEVLAALNFLIHYNMAVVKNIEVQQIKNTPPALFKHIIVELDNNYNDVGEKDRERELEKPTDMQSVLIYKKDISNNLNLSPFILDQNALIREYNSKVYFFAYTSDKGLHYYWIENEQDTIIVDEDEYNYIHSQFDRAKQVILNAFVKLENAAEEDDDIW